MKKYFRIRLGVRNAFAKQCFDGNFVGVDFGIQEDLTSKLPEEWRDFNKSYIPIYLKAHPDKPKVAAGLFCGLLWTVAKGMKIGDIIICPDGTSNYKVGEITSDYIYAPSTSLPHRRLVKWNAQSIDRASMSDELKTSSGSSVTVCDLSRYITEIEKLIGLVPQIISNNPDVEDVAAFVMEKHLEDFLVQNWANTDLGKIYDIYEVEGEQVGQQYQTDTGPLDILAISKDKKRLLVVELKKGRASDAVVGQVLRYMGHVQEELADNGQTVEGVIIALEDDLRIRKALAMVPTINFFRYQIGFKLIKS